MLRAVVLFTLVTASPAFADSPSSEAEQSWLCARNHADYGAPYPAGFGLSPERIDAPEPRPEWTFWSDDWTAAARAWTRGIYVAFKLGAEGHHKAARNEMPYLEKVVARLNVLANRTRKQDRAAVDQALDEVLLGGVQRAAAEAGLGDELHLAKYRGVVSELVSATEDDRRLARRTREAALEWKMNDSSAHDQRAVQTIFGAGAIGYGVWATSLTSPEHFASAAIAGILALTAANTAGRAIFPLTSRFRWKENMVRAPLSKCETALIAKL